METIIVTAAIIQRDKQVLIAQRKIGSHLGGMWEFPGGKLEPGEDPKHGIIREIREELGVEIEPGRIFDVLNHTYPEKSILLIVYEANLGDEKPQTLDCEAIAWVNGDNYEQYNYAPADAILVGRFFKQ